MLLLSLVCAAPADHRGAFRTNPGAGAGFLAAAPREPGGFLREAASCWLLLLPGAAGGCCDLCRAGSPARPSAESC